MSNSNFDNHGVDNSGTRLLQYAAFVVTAFTKKISVTKNPSINSND